ncbi:rhodanese-like domain-containing protein [Edaphosphingomonas haloaromaticamans]|uniref:Inner membrane protein YgaP n=1 Tax=Edaphosphingomonas haloaromaticamans TaxID=653954 RepID=A0A1S1HIS1_9SPHN|nr:rhodanese-like domain-containing protein [Sphingomonas haloaromaticamans]OHT21742.1 Inner membrane protein YgaP [Sphingomonas haloaromaticamans]
MFGLGKSKSHRELQPLELKSMLADGSALLIDVREPDEFAAGHIAGAVNIPLSIFSPRNVPDAAGRTVVLQCAGGKRSGMALDRCAQAQAAIDTHLGGGIGAWKNAGLPIVSGK